MKERYVRVQSLVRKKDRNKYLNASELRKELVSDIRENEAIILEMERKLRQVLICLSFHLISQFISFM